MALCFCLLCLPVTAVFAAPMENCPGDCTHQAAIDTTHYDTLPEALTAASDGCTVTLLTDISDANFVIDKAITLDLNGMTIAAPDNAEESLLTAAKDLTIKNGTLTANNGACLSIGDCDVTIEEKVTMISTEASTIQVSGNSKLTIRGGKFHAKEHAVVMEISKDTKIEPTITGGTFTTQKDTFLIHTTDDATAPEKFVSGGTYNKNPSLYIADGCGIIENSDSTYTVVSSYILTFQSGGASGTMAPVSVPCGSSFCLPQCGYYSDMDFIGWDIDGKTYAVGAEITPKGNLTITALWKAHSHYGGSATCLSPAICAGCGCAYGPYGDHDLSYSGGYAASCDCTGMIAHSVCNTCGLYFVDGEETSAFSLSTPALGHQWKTEKAKPATCTEAGSKEHRICSICGTIQISGKDAEKQDLIIPALGHTMEAVNAVPATCTQSGVQAHEHCTTCDQLFQQNKAVTLEQMTSALSSHVLHSQWLSDETYHWKTCVDCDSVFRQNTHTDADADNLCDDCGFVMAAEATVLPEEEPKESSWLFLIPIAAAAVIATATAVSTAAKKRK